MGKKPQSAETPRAFSGGDCKVPYYNARHTVVCVFVTNRDNTNTEDTPGTNKHNKNTPRGAFFFIVSKQINERDILWFAFLHNFFRLAHFRMGADYG